MVFHQISFAQSSLTVRINLRLDFPIQSQYPRICKAKQQKKIYKTDGTQKARHASFIHDDREARDWS